MVGLNVTKRLDEWFESNDREKASDRRAKGMGKSRILKSRGQCYAKTG